MSDFNIKKCECGGEYKVYDSRITQSSKVVYRHKKCGKCGKSIMTAEFVTNLFPSELESLDLSKQLFKPEREAVLCGAKCDLCSVHKQGNNIVLKCNHDNTICVKGKPAIVATFSDKEILKKRISAPRWCPKQPK